MPLLVAIRFLLFLIRGKGWHGRHGTYFLRSQIHLALMLQPQHSDVDAALDLLERYVFLLYDKTSSNCHVNEARLVQKAGMYIIFHQHKVVFCRAVY